jgi:hypothetical protein
MRVATPNAIVDQMAARYRTYALGPRVTAQDYHKHWSALDEGTRDAWRRPFLETWDILIEQVGIWIRAQDLADGNDLSALEMQFGQDMALDRVVDVVSATENQL